ncbi:hypothetical protein A2U01_0080348, partial [Trifolium medium]|nr:hypothetical protein [Trifolium medium]
MVGVNKNNGEVDMPFSMPLVQTDPCDDALASVSEEDPDYDPYIPETTMDLPQIAIGTGTDADQCISNALSSILYYGIYMIS